MIKVAILLFDNVEELDAVGPFQVFSSAETVFPNSFEIKTAAVGGSHIVTAVNGLKMVAGHLLDELESVDVLVIPGGVGSRAVAAKVQYSLQSARIARGRCRVAGSRPRR